MSELAITIDNVGGIDHLEQTFSDPITVITGSNASNKTSMLQAIAFGLGRSTVPIRSGASEARVEIKIDGHEVVRTAKPKGRGITTTGDSLFEGKADIELFERFACLFEFNEVRQAVRDGRSVEELLKEPMNLNALESQRADLLNKKTTLNKEVRQLSDVEGEKERRQRELSATRDRITELESDLDELRERQVESTADNGVVAELREERASLVHQRQTYERQIDELTEAIERLESELGDAEAKLEEARSAEDTQHVEQLRAEREEIRADLEDIVDRVEVLQSVLTANREMLDSSYTGVLGEESSLVEDTVTCWACGNEATASDFEETTDDLRELIERDKQRRNEYRPRLDEIESKIADWQKAQSHVSELEATVSDRKESLENRRESLETKRDSLKEIRDELSGFDERIAEHETEQSTEVSELQEQIEGLRVDLHAARSEADRLESCIGDLEDQLDVRAEKKSEIDRLTDEITSLTDRIETMEQNLREGFNDAISDLIDVLDYEQIERIWLDGNFDLIVAREVDSVVREDEVSHLSESEREMVGLVLALAGYVAYDVSDVAPVLLMDTLGAFDSNRTAKLISYFADKAPHLLVALLPDSADAFDDAVTRGDVISTTSLAPSV